MTKIRSALALGALVSMTVPVAAQSEFDIPYAEYQLPNGLNVVLHEDRSDPIAAVAILYHVGSGREVPGRTGFAHLFEHMMFQASQNVGQDQFFQKIQAAGGTLNGGTSFDQTIYFQVVPNNALEMVLWLEADRMGYLLPTVTDEAFLNQQEVVQNEKRQRVDNQPYGHTTHVLGKLLYPDDHPYNWNVIGSFEDLANASITDIHEFFQTWYGPNNATLVVAGDFDVDETRAWIERYFGELPSGPTMADPAPRPPVVSSTVHVYHEDDFASSPELNLVFPTVEQFNDDAYPLQLLGLLLSDGQSSPLYRTIVEEGRLAPSASAFQSSLEIAGTFRFRIRTFPAVDLTDVEQAVYAALERFETEGFDEDDLDRIKARYETGFYNGISSVLGKSFQLALYNEFAGSPGYLGEDLQRYMDVTQDDVWRVYRQYIEGQNYVATSFVPQGQVELVVDGSELFPIEEEEIESAGVAGTQRLAENVEVPEVPSAFDRSVEPSKGPAPSVDPPSVWTHTYANGLTLLGIEQKELPLVQFNLTLRGGMLADDPERVGVANLITDLMMQGTARRTPVELEQAIDALGATISMSTGDESITIVANTLRSRLGDVYGLFEEILLEPRWDATEFERIQRETVESLNRRQTNPAAVASDVFRRVLYGDDHILANNTLGSAEAVQSFTTEDLRAFYDANFAPNVSHIAIVGDIGQAEAIELFRPLESNWARKTVELPVYAEPEALEQPTVFFVDVPQARQSEIRVGHLGVARDHEDYYPIQVMNYMLGGNFNSRVNMILREEKGYTYGARSQFAASEYPGPFVASSAVRSNVTLESAEIFRDEIARYRDGITPEDLQFTRSAMIASNARRFETLGALRSMLGSIARYDLPHDYIQREEEVVAGMTLDRHRELARRYIDLDRMIYLVVGDAETQLDRLKELGFGDPILLDRNGRRVTVF
ncbi:MAG: insulinase family protein [Gemmatimonadetes bacterium]|nr:insulinase family protein [Gemmatimonadota bacterium]